MTVVGVISDTHKLLRPEAKAVLADTDLIVHAGDIGSQQVIDELSQLAPVRAVRGNVDSDAWAEAYPIDEVVEVGDRTLYVLHDLGELDLEPSAAGFDVVIAGHSHQPKIEAAGGVLYFNPGSAGPRRFKLPIALGVLRIDEDEIVATIHALETGEILESRSIVRSE